MLGKKYLLVIIVLGIVVTLGFATPYTPPIYNSINFTLCSSYTPPIYNSINFTLGLDEPCVVDTCNPSSPLTANHLFNCSDNCTQLSNLDAGGYNISIIGVGTFTTNVSIFNWTDVHIEGINSSDRCIVTCKQGGCFD